MKKLLFQQRGKVEEQFYPELSNYWAKNQTIDFKVCSAEKPKSTIGSANKFTVLST